MSELMLDVGQANELKMAFRRAGYEAGDVKALSEGDVLAQVREVLLGRARIVPIEMEMLPVAQATCNTFTVLPNLSLAEVEHAINVELASSLVSTMASLRRMRK